MTNIRPTPQSDRRSVVEAFAQTLSDIRQAAGQPSFRQMAQTSGCISHATLHEATRGKRLPTWETTEQFLIACSADPVAWREEWQRADRLANRRIAAVSVSHPMPSAIAPQQDSDLQGTEPMPVSVRVRHVARRAGSVKTVLAAVLAAVLLLATGYAAATWTRPETTPSSSADAGKPVSAEAEVEARSAVPAAVARSGERTVGSVTCPYNEERAVRTFTAGSNGEQSLEFRDSASRPLCSTVGAGQRVTVGFTITNRGSSTMSGWKLHLVRSSGTCFSSQHAQLPLVPLTPGRTHSGSTTFVTPVHSGECSAEYEPRDADGKRVFAEGSTVPFAVVVE